MFFSFLDLQAAHKYKKLRLKMKLGKDSFTSNYIVKILQYFNSGGFASQARLWDLIEV